MEEFTYPIRTKQFINLIKDYEKLPLNAREKSELDFFLLSQTPLKSNYVVIRPNRVVRCPLGGRRAVARDDLPFTFLHLLDNFCSSELNLMTHFNVQETTDHCYICLTEFQNTEIEKMVNRLKDVEGDYELH